jgi:hypothetical protein
METCREPPPPHGPMCWPLTIPGVKHFRDEVVNEGDLGFRDAAGVSVKDWHDHGQVPLLLLVRLQGRAHGLQTPALAFTAQSSSAEGWRVEATPTDPHTLDIWRPPCEGALSVCGHPSLLHSTPGSPSTPITERGLGLLLTHGWTTLFVPSEVTELK